MQPTTNFRFAPLQVHSRNRPLCLGEEGGTLTIKDALVRASKETQTSYFSIYE